MVNMVKSGQHSTVVNNGQWSTVGIESSLESPFEMSSQVASQVNI